MSVFDWEHDEGGASTMYCIETPRGWLPARAQCVALRQGTFRVYVKFQKALETSSVFTRERNFLCSALCEQPV